MPTFAPSSKAEENMLYAYEKGYRVVGNEVISARGTSLKLNASGKNYNPRFSVRAPAPSRETYKVEASKLSAYQKFGDAIFNPDLVIRHLDADPWNIRESNFELMTHQESQMVKPAEVRMASAKTAASHLNQYDNEAVREFYAQCKSYKKTMQKFGIPSKGTLYYILHKRQPAKERK